MQKKSESEKDKWGKPKLIILVRAKPGEATLTLNLCKMPMGLQGPGPLNYWDTCTHQEEDCYFCFDEGGGS